MYNNPVLDRLPRHLTDLIIEKPYNSYTWQDHSIWRYVMKQNVAFLKDKAHAAYLSGLKKTGISIDQIPDIQTMNDILKTIGWGAVTVDGFIPPAAFMEFQANNVLVIAADIRPIDQVEYTPAPDIIHEAAGHAPIIADEEYAAYLKYFGEIGSKAFSSAADYELYEAIRYLSILKADPHAGTAQIDLAVQLLEAKESSLGIPSEMAYIRNLHWWTVEYGLVGDLNHPKIYGAGLLSSIGESAGALSDRVKKLPYTIDAVYYNFDITKPQPQLFVTPDFGYLTEVLDTFASRMALRKGGVEGILKAVESGSVATCVYSSGLQVSGVFQDYILHQNQPAYIRTTGPTMLSFNNTQLEGHGVTYHSHGFGSPIGSIKGTLKPPRFLNDDDLKEVGIEKDKKANFEFESGVKVSGSLKSCVRKEGKLLLLSFTECLVRYQDQILFEPSWGVFDMAVGESIISAYTGPADADAFGLSYPVPTEKTHQILYTSQQLELHQHYGQLRQMRNADSFSNHKMQLMQSLLNTYPDEWLLMLELLEVAVDKKVDEGLKTALVNNLLRLKHEQPKLDGLISRGLKLFQL
jgi:phenylalanine-4-hydroxylase